MQLVIHDLTTEAWDRIKDRYPDAAVVSDSGGIRPCVGCFGCWNKDPGRCVIDDGYGDMGYLIHHAAEVTVISRYTYGGFSGFVKNVFDRCLAYVLPQFELAGGETHHKRRYDEVKPFTFIFYGHDLSEEEKESARRYVRAVCANMRSAVRDVRFIECEEAALSDGAAAAERIAQPPAAGGRTVLLNGSMRSKDGNSARLARRLRDTLASEAEIMNLSSHLNDMPALVSALEDAETLVLCMPLYVDGLPSQVIRLMETFERGYRGGSKRIYLLANMGLYESSQLVGLFGMVRQWCAKMGFSYCGGLGVSAGELLGTLMEALPFRAGPTRKAEEGIRCLAEAVDAGAVTKDIYAEPHMFPRALYIRIANSGWDRMAKANGIAPEDLYRTEIRLHRPEMKYQC